MLNKSPTAKAYIAQRQTDGDAHKKYFFKEQAEGTVQKTRRRVSEDGTSCTGNSATIFQVLTLLC